MTVEITSENTMDPTIVAGDFAEFVNELNLAAAAGKRFVIMTEVLPDGSEEPVALNAMSITRARNVPEASDSFLGS